MLDQAYLFKNELIDTSLKWLITVKKYVTLIQTSRFH